MRVGLILEDPPVLGPGANLVLRVEAEGLVIANLPPIPLGSGPPMGRPLPELRVPHGVDRRLYAELYDAGTLLRFGVSAPFALTEGADDAVVEVKLGPPPTARLRLVTEGPGLVHTATVALFIETERATLVVVSNTPAFEAPLEVALNSPVVRVAWDLERGRAARCGPEDAACPRQVYVRALEENGYGSPIATATVTLDLLPPSLVEDQAAVAIAGGPGSWRADVQAVGPGAEVQVVLTPTEALGAAPRLRGRTEDGAEVPFEACQPTGPRWRCGWRATDPLPNAGALSLLANLIDRAGNRAEVEAGTLSLDAAPPTPPVGAGVAAELAPYGTLSDPRPAASIFGQAGSVEAGAILIAVDREDLDSARELGRSEPADLAGDVAAFAIPPRYEETLWVVAVDGAGWPSDADPLRPGAQATRVTHRTITATFDPRSPHLAYWIAEAGRGRAVPRDLARDPELVRGALAAIDGLTARAEATPRWFQRWPVPPPPLPRLRVGLGFDPGRQQVVMFGGLAASALDETWIWRGGAWISDQRAIHPPPLERPLLAYDGPGHRILLYGGRGAAGPADETWAYDDDGWTQLHPAVSPSPRELAVMAYDESLGAIVLYGGLAPGGATGLADTWIWRSEADTWAPLVTQGSPGPRLNAAMTYDGTAGRLRLYGGSTNFSDFRGDGWELVGDTWQPWTSTGTVSPPALVQAGLVWDESNQELLLYGGYEAPGPVGQVTRAIWAHDAGGRWRRLPDRESEALAYRAAAAPEPLSRGVLFFGGDRAGVRSDESWVRDPSGWREATPRAGPGPRAQVALLSRDGVTVELSGGQDLLGPFVDGWRWNGWRFEPDAPLPLAVSAATAIYDPRDDHGYLCGTSASDETCFERTAGGWSPLNAVGPGARPGARLALDPSGGVLLLGGLAPEPTSEVWRYFGGTWSAAPSLAAPRAALAAAIDSGLTTLWTLTGEGPGGLATADLGRYDGAAWQNLPDPNLVPRFGASLFAPTWSGSLLLFGGWTGSEALDELLGLDPSGNVDPIAVASTRPPARLDAPVAVTRSSAYVYGGCGRVVSCRPLDDLWELRPSRKPAVVMEFALPAPESDASLRLAVEHRPNLGTARLEFWDTRRARWITVPNGAEQTVVADAAAFRDREGRVSLRIVDPVAVRGLDAVQVRAELGGAP